MYVCFVSGKFGIDIRCESLEEVLLGMDSKPRLRTLFLQSESFLLRWKVCGCPCGVCRHFYKGVCREKETYQTSLAKGTKQTHQNRNKHNQPNQTNQTKNIKNPKPNQQKQKKKETTKSIEVKKCLRPLPIDLSSFAEAPKMRSLGPSSPCSSSAFGVGAKKVSGVREIGRREEKTGCVCVCVCVF